MAQVHVHGHVACGVRAGDELQGKRAHAGGRRRDDLADAAARHAADAQRFIKYRETRRQVRDRWGRAELVDGVLAKARVDLGERIV